MYQFLLFLLLPCVVINAQQARRGVNPRLRINETRYFGDLLELALKDMSEADVILKYGGPEMSANITGGLLSITLGNCRVAEIQNVYLNSTTHEVYYLYGGRYPFFTGYYYFNSSKLTFDYSIKNNSDVVVSSGVATLQQSKASSEVYFYVDHNSTGQYYIISASGVFGDVGDLADVELTGTSEGSVKSAIAEIYRSNELRIQAIPSTALNYYILKYLHIVDFNEYIIRK